MRVTLPNKMYYITLLEEVSDYYYLTSEELNNLELAQIIADSQGKELKYEMVDFHSSRPGHDLRYSLSGEKMKKLGWQPSIKLTERIKQVVEWSLNNENWIEL